MKKELNNLLCGILIFYIASNVLHFFVLMVQAALTPSFANIWNLITTVAIVIVLAMILYHHKAGVYGFFAFQLIAGIVLDIHDGYSFIHFAVSIAWCIFLLLILQLQKNGVSAWNTIMHPDEYYDDESEE